MPCLFTDADRFRFKNAIYFSALKNALRRQQVIGRLTEQGFQKALELIKTMSSPSDISSIVDALADAKLIEQLDADKTPQEAVKAIYSALAGQSVPGDSFDVSCSQSVLTYQETSDIFATRVANNYVAIQVVVRNLNPDKEFLMHDVQIAADYTGSQDQNDKNNVHDNRFVAGRDKLLVRGVALRGQSDDPRNRMIRIAEAIGNIASASTIGLKAIDFRNGVSVFSSAFIPGIKNIFPDYTVDQLNRLNDLAFSANTSYKLVIAKNGASPFVTFIPVKIFADKYKTWTAAELHAFNEKIYVVFAGVHITEENSGQITATGLTCPTDKSGLVDLTGSSSTIDCTLKGDNLQSISTVRLRNAHESTDAAQVDADLSSSGSVKFDAAQLRALQGAEYSVILVDKSGHEISTKATLKLAPSIASVDDIKIGTGSCKEVCTVNVTGSRLGNVQSIIITQGTSTAEGTLTFDATNNTWTATFPTSKLTADGP